MAIEITDNDKPDVEHKPAPPPPSSLGARRDAALAQPLKLLEAKISEVQSRWHAVEEQLGQKDRTIAGLRADLDTRAAMIKRLEGALALAVNARASAEDASAASQAELSHLETQLQQQTDELTGYQEKLTAATGEYQALQEELDSAYGQIDGLRDDLERHREVADQIDPNGLELYANEDTVEHAVKHLEQYIRQREEDKSAANDQLFQYADALTDLEKRVSEQDALLRGQQENNERLEIRNEELGNLCAERDATIEALNSQGPATVH